MPTSPLVALISIILPKNSSSVEVIRSLNCKG